MIDLTTSVAGLDLANPVMCASGTFEYNPAAPPPFDVNRLGAVVVKSITLAPQSGNSPSRLAESASGLINSVGIPSLGLEDFLCHGLGKYNGLRGRLVVSVAGYTPEEYAHIVAAVAQRPQVDALELNFSCPNLRSKIMPAQDAGLLRECMAAARAVTTKPLWAKLSPNVTSIVEMAEHAQDTGADAVVLINTIRATAIDIYRHQVILGHHTGGLSGPAILPIALAMVWDVALASDIPVIGVGGISSWEDALMFILAGASAVQVGTATFRQPLAMMHILDGLAGHLAATGISRLRELVGTALASGGGRRW